MTGSTPTGGETKPKTAKGGAMDAFKGFLIFALFIIGAGFGGYFFGTMQKFAPVQNVPPGTPGAVAGVSSGTAESTGSVNPNGLKKKYWIHSSGHEHIGYAITVYVNGQLVDKFFTPNKRVDITKWVKPGENSVRFDAEVLPVSMNEHRGSNYYYLNLAIESGEYDTDPKAVELINYKRNASETEKFNDTMTFVTME